MGAQLASHARLVNGCCANLGVDTGRIVDLQVGDFSGSEFDGGYRGKESYYKDWDTLRGALASGDVVLVRGNWLEEVYRRGEILPRRQELPQTAIWPVEELFLRVKDHRLPTPQILSISYSWLSREHPDPEGFHLRSFAPLLRHFARHCKIGVDSLAIFIDWCSLPQTPRTQVEDAVYQRGLQTIDLWYAHWAIEVWLLTRVPEGASLYEDRGWPKFERSVATLTRSPESTLDLGLLRGGWKSWGQVAADCQAERRPPETPERFAASLSAKAFGVREDEGTVAGLYREAFDRALSQEAQLWYTGLGWSDREAQDLAMLLKLCGSTLRDLELRGNDIANAGAAALAEVLPFCSALERLSLDGNCIGQDAQKVLRDTWQRCGKPRFGLELGEQNFRPRNAMPAYMQANGSRTGDSPPGRGLRAGSGLSAASSTAAASEQLNQLLARQAAFEARIESSVARLTDGLVEVADAVGARQRRMGAGTPTSGRSGTLGPPVGAAGSSMSSSGYSAAPTPTGASAPSAWGR